MIKRRTTFTHKTLLLCLVIGSIGALHRPACAMRATSHNETPLASIPAAQAEVESTNDPAAILASARIIYVCSRTAFVKSEVIENELLKRAEFKQTGLLVTRDPNAADLVMDVRRSNFTTEYPYVVVDARTRLVVASGKVNSLFGTAAAKIARGFIKQVQTARTPAAARSKK